MDKPTQNTNTIHGLVKRRRDLQAESDYVSGKLAALEADILTLDNAIRLIDPKFNIASIRPKTLQPRTNELRKYQVDVIQFMSSDGGWVSAQEIAIKVVPDYEKLTKQEKALARSKIRGFLYRQAKRGWVLNVDGKFQIDTDRAWNALD